LLEKMLKTAPRATPEYIRRRIETRLRRQTLVVLLELGVLVLAYGLNRMNPTLFDRTFASLVLWSITLYNLYELFFSTIPELREVHRLLRGKVGYTLKHFLKVSLVTELMEGNLLFLSLCLILAVSSRTALGSAFSYFEPWRALLSLP